MSELQPGVFLGRYELLVRIGRGGMASVWVARERSAVSGNQRLVAVKAMLPELATHSEFRSMFLSEVQVIQSIQHDNVVRVFDVSEHHNVLYMVMEWVEGDSLRNIIRASRPMGALPPEIAVCIAADAASGLHAAHELRDWDGQLRGVVHCDVSPHNILVGLEGKAKLVDFGIANALEGLGATREVIQGKVSYMSPEQAQGGQIDRRADIFALGIVLYEMSVGEQLFRGHNAAHTLELVKHGTIPRPSQLMANYPRKLETIVLKALNRDPNRRFQTAEEFEYELSTYLTEEHAVVSHPVVAQLLLQLLGPRIEKRREVITSIVASIDGQRPIGNLNHRGSIPDMSVVSDVLNFTATGRSEPNLGIVARFDLDSTGGIAHSTPHASNGSKSGRWRSVLLIVLLFVVPAGASYFFALRTRTAETNASNASAVDAGSRGTAESAVSKTSATGSARSDGVVSVENLPVDSEQAGQTAGGKVPRGAYVRRSGKSFDELVNENAAAAARKGEIAENEQKTVTTPSAAAPPKPAPTEERAPSQEPAPTQETAPAPAPAPEPEEPPPGIDRVAAVATLQSLAQLTRACRSLGPPPATNGQASVTFGLSGKVKSVSLSQAFAGTPIGNCIKSTFKDAQVPPFKGEPTTLTVPFQIPE